jgi:uncharacterized protein
MAIRLRRRIEMRSGNELARRIGEFLDAHHVMSLATCGPYGPHATNLFYVHDELSLLWVSDRKSAHSTSLEIDPQVGATIAPDHRDFAEVRGVQIFGRAYRVNDAAARDSARALLAGRYPTLQKLSDAMIAQAYSSAAVYQLLPNRIVLIDNRQGFGHKETLDLQT